MPGLVPGGFVRRLVLIILLICLLILPCVVSSYRISFITQVLIYGLFAVSLDLLVGYSGLVSFNHATFFGVGAYGAAILSLHGFSSFWLVLPAGICLSASLAAVLGFIVLRSRGAYFLLITLAFNQMIYALAWKWRSFTGGDDGLPGVNRPDIGWHISMWNNQYFYYLVLLLCLAAFIALWKLIHSHLGQIIVGTRESETRMQALGYNTAAVKWLTYVAAAGVAGLAGILFVYFNGFVSPQDLNWSMSGLVILMVIIGGPGTLAGPVFGAAVILSLQQLVSSYTEQWPLVTGIIFVVCVLYAYDGLYGMLKKITSRVLVYYDSAQSHKRP